jgi:hypothetical protein
VKAATLPMWSTTRGVMPLTLKNSTKLKMFGNGQRSSLFCRNHSQDEKKSFMAMSKGVKIFSAWKLKT